MASRLGLDDDTSATATTTRTAATAYGLDKLDAAAIRLAAPRAFTQRVSRHVYDLTTDDGRRRSDVIGYQSRLGGDFTNWAIYALADLAPLTTLDGGTIPPTDPDLVRALRLHGLHLA